MWLCVDPMRLQKTRRIMHALRAGLRGCGRVCVGEPPNDAPFVVWGHRWLAEKIVPPAMQNGIEWWLVDNGYHLPAGGQATGYYSLTLNGVAPVVLPDPDMTRLPVAMAPWRREGRHIVVAVPGSGFGRMFGFNAALWQADAIEAIRSHTDRPIVVREKQCNRPLGADLAGAHALVTHSSKVAVDAVRAGVPVIVAHTSAAAPVGSLYIDEIENPPMPDDRATWWASLMGQQFTLNEMASGYAWAQMQRIREAAGG